MKVTEVIITKEVIFTVKRISRGYPNTSEPEVLEDSFDIVGFSTVSLRLTRS